jgi:hypothetical protein
MVESLAPDPPDRSFCLCLVIAELEQKISRLFLENSRDIDQAFA